jgi:hypothetical protein
MPPLTKLSQSTYAYGSIAWGFIKNENDNETESSSSAEIIILYPAHAVKEIRRDLNFFYQFINILI